MPRPNLKFGIPDLDLSSPSGRKINPASLAGHELIVLFCPSDAKAASQEIDAYRQHCAEFVARDAWLLTFAHDGQILPITDVSRGLVIRDPDGQAWAAFRDLTESPEEMDPSRGATFLFTRGGGLHRYWRGAGHIDEVLAELSAPLFRQNHNAS